MCPTYILPQSMIEALKRERLRRGHRLFHLRRQIRAPSSGRPYLRPIYLRYPVKYFAARDRAPAPNTLAAALLPSSFRNKDFALFFSCSDTSA
jgi:hypothetical protein